MVTTGITDNLENTGGIGAAGAGTARDQEAESRPRNLNNDPLFLSNSDHPGAQLTPMHFDGTNFTNWSRLVKLALGAKTKLCFIVGTNIQPPEDSDDFQRWIKADYMVRCWILNSMEPRIAQGFIYVESARELWTEMIERYAQSNRPLIFQLKRNLAHLKQDNMSVLDYYTRMKLLWDEIQNVKQMPICECGAIKACSCLLLKRILDDTYEEKIMQFLMGLNDSFDLIRSQILATEPLPTVSKVFNMVYTYEQHKRVSGEMNAQVEMNAMSTGRHQVSNQKTSNSNYGDKKSTVGQSFGPKRDYRDLKRQKMERKCDYCKERGHVMDSCFKLHGYPDWYKEYKEKQGESKVASNVQMESPFEYDDLDKGKQYGNASSSAEYDSALVNAVCQEVIRAMKGKQKADSTVNFAGPF